MSTSVAAFSSKGPLSFSNCHFLLALPRRGRHFDASAFFFLFPGLRSLLSRQGARERCIITSSATCLGAITPRSVGVKAAAAAPLGCRGSGGESGLLMSSESSSFSQPRAKQGSEEEEEERKKWNESCFLLFQPRVLFSGVCACDFLDFFFSFSFYARLKGPRSLGLPSDTHSHSIPPSSRMYECQGAWAGAKRSGSLEDKPARLPSFLPPIHTVISLLEISGIAPAFIFASLDAQFCPRVFTEDARPLRAQK